MIAREVSERRYVGHRLIEAGRARGFSVSKLAAALDVTPSWLYMSRNLNYRGAAYRILDEDYAARASALLGEPVETLFFLAPDIAKRDESPNSNDEESHVA